MRYLKYVGAAAAVALVICCFQPWVHIASRDILVYGMDPGSTNYGKPGLMHVIFSALFLGLVFLRPVWTRRLNLFFQAFNVAWAFRNLLLIGACAYGECPEKLAALYALPVLTMILLLTVLLAPGQIQTGENR
ncbi:hypothetical protein [Flaviaesturariibacter aridisoli]|uniref:DUF4293 family protein n=1 Tax=Flaviaesturariibacter aridisoli TaxID=2545761 RepID=A0A4R4E5J2_9BACT|nr:hypothetical protein [Flaviaesturariibacter aridisoli]TCZ73301.1 hypothetical protein E0486_06415 [Flaviaesturariibacter aridisoli]